MLAHMHMWLEKEAACSELYQNECGNSEPVSIENVTKSWLVKLSLQAVP